MSHRLPRSIVPSHYVIELRPDLNNATFDGIATIETTVTETTRSLVCNAIDLDIAWVAIDGQKTDFTLDEDFEQLSVDLGLSLIHISEPTRPY